MRNFANNRVLIFMTVIILVVGSISIVGSNQFVMGLDSKVVKNLVKNKGISVNDKLSKVIPRIKTPGIHTLIFALICTKVNGGDCVTELHQITITIDGSGPVDHFKFRGDDAPGRLALSNQGLELDLSPGKYTITEEISRSISRDIPITFISGTCNKVDSATSFQATATGTIPSGQIPPEFCMFNSHLR